MLIPRNPQVPPLTKSQLDDIEQTVFFEVPPQPSDILLIFGSPIGDWEAIANFARTGIAKLIIPSGKYGVKAPPGTIPQAHLIRDVLLQAGIDPKQILIEDQSTNTGENVRFTKKLLEEHDIDPQSILFACKAHHTGRCARTIRTSFKKALLSVLPYNGIYGDHIISKLNWRTDPFSKQRVYGEYLRILQYTEEGKLTRSEEL